MKSKSKTLIAFLLCILTCLLGSLFFGIIYDAGYYIFIIPILEVIAGAMVYQKMTRRSGLNIAIAILLSTALVVAFNIVAIVICKITLFAKAHSMSFGSAADVFFYNVRNDANLNADFNSTITSSSLFALLGAAIVALILIVLYNKENKEMENHGTNAKIKIKQKRTSKSKKKLSQKNANNTALLIEEKLYSNFYDDVKQALMDLSLSKDAEMFKQKINKIKSKHIKNLPEDLKSQFILRNENMLQTNQTKLVEQTLLTMNKLLKPTK